MKIKEFWISLYQHFSIFMKKITIVYTTKARKKLLNWFSVIILIGHLILHWTKWNKKCSTKACFRIGCRILGGDWMVNRRKNRSEFLKKWICRCDCSSSLRIANYPLNLASVHSQKEHKEIFMSSQYGNISEIIIIQLNRATPH